jgi:hypothetical protein
MGFMIPIVIVAIVFGCIGWIAYLIVEVVRSRHRTRATSELQGKLIDRLGTGDVGAFLTSENGGALLRQLAEQPSPAGAAAHVRILRALQSGLVLLAVGIGMFLFMWSQPLPFAQDEIFGLGMTATIATALGVGLLAAAASSFILSRRLGLLVRGAAE